jgi:hypothetical protein
VSLMSSRAGATVSAEGRGIFTSIHNLLQLLGAA